MENLKYKEDKKLKDQLVSFVLAKLLKDKNFNIECDNGFVFNHITEELLEENFNYWNGLTNSNWNYYERPTQSLLQRWLREKYNLHINVYCTYDENDETYNTYWNVNIINLEWGSDKEQHLEKQLKIYKLIYEEALEEGLLEALKLIKS